MTKPSAQAAQASWDQAKSQKYRPRYQKCKFNNNNIYKI